MPALQQLDVDLAIGSTEQGDAVKSTAYLETVIFELQQHILDLEVIDISVATTYTQTKFDNGIFCDATGGDFTVTMIDPALALKRRVVVKNETGSASTITIAATTGTVEVTSLTDTQSVIFAPRSGAWVAV